MKYNWQQKNWKKFHYNLAEIEGLLSIFTAKTGRVDGLMTALPELLQQDTIIDIMVAEAIKSSEIEGEMLSRPDVMSSIKNNLGLSTKPKQISDLRAVGIAELMVQVRNDYAEPVSKSMLFRWHTMLMQGTGNIKSGAWRTHKDSMLIVSGAIGKEQVHFEAPPSKTVQSEMRSFIQWFNNTTPGNNDDIKYSPVRAAIAHLYFESIHPFEDGNGRIGRALAEKVLSQGIGRPILLSISQSIESDRTGYYAALKEAQQSNEITSWLTWFVKMLLKAQQQVESKIEFTLKKTKLLDRVKSTLNERQLKVLLRMLKEGAEKFKGGMSAKKYMTIAKTTKATATRDIQDLVRKNIFIPSGGGRSTNYQIKL